MKTIEMEISLAEYFSPRVNLIVPNVSWGFYSHECDLLLISKSGYATEIEIKISQADLKADLKKKHGHINNKIKYLYFALPEYLESYIEYVPEHAGIILVGEREGKKYRWLCQYSYKANCKIIRSPQKQGNYKLSIEEQSHIGKLGAMRIWGLKGKILTLK